MKKNPSQAMRNPSFRVAVDTGGTFTDVYLVKEDTGNIFTAKVSSTPSNPERAVLDGITRAVKAAGVDIKDMRLLLHGTTVTTNSIINGNRNRNPAALITTRGFKDILIIGRQNRPDLYNFWATKPEPLIQRRFIFEVEERVLADGNIYQPLNIESIYRIIKKIKALEINTVAISLIHSYINPAHEQKIKKIIEEIHPSAWVTLSSDILPEPREYERTSTTAINAVLQPLLASYLEKLEESVKSISRPRLFIMQSNGGLITFEQAGKEAVRTVLSGPAGGVMAGVQTTRQTGRPNIITFDMGGTSTDICLIKNGEARFTSEGNINGYPLRMSMLDIHTIGAGGGSIAWIDYGNSLRVGPDSAGAEPGPACYGLGGRKPTVTDANLVLGRINPDLMLDQDRQLKSGLALRCLEENIGLPLAITAEKAAEGIITVINAAMTRAVRVISVQRGYDPREFTLFAFGGAGPLHAAELAKELNIPQVLIPPHPGVTSAYGIANTDVRKDYERTVLQLLKNVEAEEIQKMYNDMREKAIRELIKEKSELADIYFVRKAEFRYPGQSYELTIPLPSGTLTKEDLIIIERSFHLVHEQEYSSSYHNMPVELVTIRLSAIMKLPKIINSPPVYHQDASRSITPAFERPVFFEGRFVNTAIYQREEIIPSQRIKGPAVIEQSDSTTLILPGMEAWLDKWGNLIINL